MPDSEHTDHSQAHDILEALATSSPSTTTELASALETHPATIERHCKSLQQTGAVRQCTGGVYTLAETVDRTHSASSLADSHTDGPSTTNPAD